MFKLIRQHDQMDCGPACLAMVSASYGKKYSLQYLRDLSFISREGVSLQSIGHAAEQIGFTKFPGKLSIDDLIENVDTLPAILHWNQNHFVVLFKISKGGMNKKINFKIADPAHGILNLSYENLTKHWITTDNKRGVALFLQPTSDFFNKEIPKKNTPSLSYLLAYLVPHKKSMLWMFILLIIGTCLSLVSPFITQNLIDKGVVEKNLNFITLILVAQLALFVGSLVVELFRNWTVLVVGTKLNINIISDFFKTLLKLPIKYFDTKLIGDFTQRIQDNERIEQFLTSQSLITLFSIITSSIFFGVLLYYDYTILVVYFVLTFISILWTFFWMKRRKSLDYYRFLRRSENQEAIYEIINGVSELKLNQFEEVKRNEWERIQQKLFKTNIQILKINQIQMSGFEFINQTKNILVTFLAATLVVKNALTLGELLAISYIIGQLNSPINQLISFFRSLQDARLSLSRLNEIKQHQEEEQVDQKQLQLKNDDNLTNGRKSGIYFKNLSFQYGGPKSSFVLKNIHFAIPEGKITAIVGASGSGKTTLMKLLLRFYDPSTGSILYNEDDITSLSPKSIRENCGVVMQDGYIFSDTIERNITTGDEYIDQKKLNHAIKIANIESLIKELPLGFNTKIGVAGNGISGGQKQRILIARAVYKNPHYIFFDEATSALDAENEKTIHDNLQSFFSGKTVMIIAHRLSTVKHADQIVVLKLGQIVEQGTHKELVSLKGEYYNLVKNQLELGS
ncbi:peptidase domain-containing ABC transporter [Myroides odoratus]|uniref:peptidase domain-containing ABC transporter n=1 Tax=Myroides odoratus TaxID=256 RepID=UPI0039B0D3EB